MPNQQPYTRRTGWAIWCDEDQYLCEELYRLKREAVEALRLSKSIVEDPDCCRIVRVEQVTRAMQPKVRKKR